MLKTNSFLKLKHQNQKRSLST